MDSIQGCFINLDRSPDRAAFMQAQLSRLGMEWVQRFPAADGAQLTLPPGCPLLPAEYGCFLSHMRALEHASPDAYTLVLEDDAELSDQLPGILARAAQGPPPDFDVAHLECEPNYSLAHLSTLWDIAARHFIGTSRRISGVGLLNSRTYYGWGTAAYLVPPRAHGRLLEILRGGLAEGPVSTVDLCFKRAYNAGQLRGAVAIPFLATIGLQWHGRSTIGNGSRMPSNQVMVLRRLLYAGDLGEIEALTRSFADAQLDPALRMFSTVLRDLAAHQRAEAQAAAAGRPRLG